MFDSSVKRGQPAKFPARRRDQGLDRGLAADGRRREAPLLDPGQPRLRREPRRRRPAGMLVFDVELLGIKTPRPAQGARGRRRPRRRAPRRRRPGSPTACSRRAPARSTRRPTSIGRGPLHGLDHRRQDVRQLGHARRAGHLPAQRRHPRLDRGRAADGRRREDPLLDPGQARLRQLAAARRPQGMLVFDVELLEIH